MSNLLYGFDLFGTFVFALTGALAAGNRKLDLFGVLFLAFLTALGGGTTRDLLIGRKPVFWLTDINYFISIAAAATITFFFAKAILRVGKIILLFDALGLGVFTIIGLRIAHGAGLHPLFAGLMGLITGVMGGILRSAFCGEKAPILSREIYATASVSGVLLFFLLAYLDLSSSVNMLLSILFIIAVRLWALYFHINLPRLKL